MSTSALWDLVQTPVCRMHEVLTPEQKAFFGEIGTMDRHPYAHVGKKVTVRCRCGEIYTCEKLEAYLSETGVRAGGAGRRLLERYRKIRACPQCGRADGHVIAKGGS